MNFLSFSIIFGVLETLDQRAFNALFRVPNNVLSEKVPSLYVKGPKTLQNSQNPGFWVHISWRLSFAGVPLLDHLIKQWIKIQVVFRTCLLVSQWHSWTPETTTIDQIVFIKIPQIQIWEVNQCTRRSLLNKTAKTACIIRAVALSS